MPRVILRTLVLGFLTLGFAACSQAAVSFDPSGPCTADGRAPGAYPDLEARIPKAYRGEPPERLDSGRTCTDEGLGTLAVSFDEVRVAGGTWTFGGTRALVLAVFAAPGLDAELLHEFYVESARGTPRVEILDESEVVIAGREGFRLDAKRVDLLETVVVWPSVDADVVNVVLTTDLPEARIQEAIEAFGSPTWGLLAVVPPDDGSDSAAAGGTLVITNECVFLEAQGIGRMLLVWPVESTGWNGESRTITFKNSVGGIVVLGDGDQITVGGSGGGTGEGGESTAEFVERMNWVAEPAPACIIESWWSVGAVEHQR